MRVQKYLSKITIQKISARPDLATYLLQILIPYTNYVHSIAYCFKKCQFTLQLCPERWFVRKMWLLPRKKSQLKILYRNLCLARGLVLAKSLRLCPLLPL